MRNGLTDEVMQAFARAEECAKQATLAKADKDRDFHERMRRKWLDLANGWRMIDEQWRCNAGHTGPALTSVATPRM